MTSEYNKKTLHATIEFGAIYDMMQSAVKSRIKNDTLNDFFPSPKRCHACPVSEREFIDLSLHSTENLRILIIGIYLHFKELLHEYIQKLFSFFLYYFSMKQPFYIPREFLLQFFSSQNHVHAQVLFDDNFLAILYLLQTQSLRQQYPLNQLGLRVVLHH